MALYYYTKNQIQVVDVYSNEVYAGETVQTLSAPQSVYGVLGGGVDWATNAGYYWTSTPTTHTCPTNGYLLTVHTIISDTEKRIYVLLFNSPNQVDVTFYQYMLTKTPTDSKGDYIETLIAEDGTYPDNGVSGSYWYTKGALYVTPTVRTDPATLITFSSARLNANLTEQGGEALIEVGFQYGETVTDNTVKVTDQSEGAYVLNLSSIDPITKYYFRAYATNSHETVYGSILDFTTLSKPLPKPVQNAPIADYETTERTPWFDMTLTAELGNSATKYSARLRLANYVSMTPAIVTLESKEGTGTWEVWDGVGDPSLDGSWGAMPTLGVDPGSRVRVKPTDNLLWRTQYYWSADAWDGSSYGYASTARALRILITLDGLYLLEIEGTPYNILSLEVAETSNGELGYLNFVLDNDGGTTNTAINYGDQVVLAIADSEGNKEEFTGLVRNKAPRGEDLYISCILGDGILSERIVKQDYTSADIGATLASILSTYCTPLTGTGIDTTTGFSAPVVSDGKTPLSVIEALRRQYGFYYFIDKDWDAQLYLIDDIADATSTIKYGN